MPDYSFSHTAKIKLSTCTYKLIISTKIAYRVNCSGPIKSNLSGLLQIDTLFQYIFYNIATAFLNSSKDIPALLAASILESIPSFTKLYSVLSIPFSIPWGFNEGGDISSTLSLAQLSATYISGGTSDTSLYFLKRSKPYANLTSSVTLFALYLFGNCNRYFQALAS